MPFIGPAAAFLIAAVMSSMDADLTSPRLKRLASLSLLQSTGEVHHRDVRRGHTEGHARQLTSKGQRKGQRYCRATVHAGDHLAHGLKSSQKDWPRDSAKGERPGLCSSSGGRDDILRGAAAASPILATSRGPIHRELRGCHGVHSGHQALHDAETVVDHLSTASTLNFRLPLQEAPGNS